MRMKIWRENIGKNCFQKKVVQGAYERSKHKILSVKSDIHITSEIDAARRHPADAAKIGMLVNQIVVLRKNPCHPEEDLWFTLARQFWYFVDVDN